MKIKLNNRKQKSLLDQSYAHCLIGQQQDRLIIELTITQIFLKCPLGLCRAKAFFGGHDVIPMRQSMSKDVLTEKEAAQYISMSQSFLRQDRMNGYRDNIMRGPDFMRLGRRSIRYRREVLDAWLEKSCVRRAV